MFFLWFRFLPWVEKVKFKTVSTRKLSYFNLRRNKSAVATPKRISCGSPRKGMSNVTRIVITHEKF